MIRKIKRKKKFTENHVPVPISSTVNLTWSYPEISLLQCNKKAEPNTALTANPDRRFEYIYFYNVQKYLWSKYIQYFPRFVDLKFQVNSLHTEVLRELCYSNTSAYVDAHTNLALRSQDYIFMDDPTIHQKGEKIEAFLTVMSYRFPQTLHKKKVGFYVEMDLSNFHGDYSYLSISAVPILFHLGQLWGVMIISEEQNDTFELLCPQSN
jgi:hypothetical protein